MEKNWPPDGYSSPREYEKNERHIALIMLAITGLFALFTLFPIIQAVTIYREMWDSFVNTLSLPHLTAVIGGPVFSALFIYILFKKVMIPIHESVHFAVGLLLNLNPKFRHEEGFFFNNPAVVALTTDIPVWKNMMMLVAPFAIIGLLSLTIMELSGGLVSGLAAVVLWINSAASAQDLYHYIRLLRIDSKAKFANFEQNNKIRTEYAIPER